MPGGILAAAQAENHTAYLVGRYVGYALVAAAAVAVLRAWRSGRLKAGLQRIAVSNKAAADAQAAAVSGASADVGGIHLHVGHNVGGVGADLDYNGPGAVYVGSSDDGEQHWVLPPGASVGDALRDLPVVPTGDGARCLPVADRGADGAVLPGAAGGRRPHGVAGRVNGGR